jgi:hypothetical protein
MSNLLDKLTAQLEQPSDKSDTLEQALEKALENTSPDHAGTPWEKRKKWQEEER